MSYIEIKGNIFNSKAEAIVNTVNCVGAMGKGIALEFRRRYPNMFEKYKLDCIEKKLVPGRIYAYTQPETLILNFAIKDDWKQPSKVEWIDSTLKQFVSGYQAKGIKSIAFPWMGAMNGGIPLDIIQSLMRHYLNNLPDIDVEVYNFDPDASDPLFDVLKMIALSNYSYRFENDSIMKRTAFREIIDLVKNGEVTSLARIAEKKIIGKTSTDKLYAFLTKNRGILETGLDKFPVEDDSQIPLF